MMAFNSRRDRERRNADIASCPAVIAIVKRDRMSPFSVRHVSSGDGCTENAFNGDDGRRKSFAYEAI